MALDDRRLRSHQRFHVSAWRGDRHVAVLSPAPDHPSPGAGAIGTELARLHAAGIRRVLTGALHEAELGPFLANGFQEHERLHLLRHDLVRIPEGAGDVRLRRAWRRDLAPVLEIDARAFDEFWALDRRGLDDAIRATPVARFRVTGALGQPIGGYAVTGRAADRGYLQRLAVDPEHHREGIGRALVADALGWLRRRGARVAMVNTQERNGGALALYRACGFVEEPTGLLVLARDLTHAPDPGGPP